MSLMRNKRLAYIAGPMAGYPNFNRATFNGTEAALRRDGWAVINPARFGEDPDYTGSGGGPIWEVSPLERAAFLKRDIEALARCDAIFMLPGWEGSVGANVELWVAHSMALDVWVADISADGLGDSFYDFTRAPVLSPVFRSLWDHVVDVRAAKVAAMRNGSPASKLFPMHEGAV